LQPHVWMVGDWQHADFREARTWLHSNASCTFFAIIDDAIAAAHPMDALITARPTVPSAIVLAQSRPGKISTRDVEKLHAAAPLARLVAISGAWCEGEGRTGRPWPGVERVPWRSWQNRLPDALGLSPTTAHFSRLPRTVTDTERIERSIHTISQARFSGNAQIHSNSLATFHAWNDLLGHLGLKGTWICPGEAPAGKAEIVLVDGWESVRDTQPSRASGGGPARVLVLDWPRPDDVVRAKNAGFCEVLAQPFLISELVAILGGLLAVQSARQESVA
jgi:hypothetical protein